MNIRAYRVEIQYALIQTSLLILSSRLVAEFLTISSFYFFVLFI
jgi:hypothetical protein